MRKVFSMVLIVNCGDLLLPVSWLLNRPYYESALVIPDADEGVLPEHGIAVGKELVKHTLQFSVVITCNFA